MVLSQGLADVPGTGASLLSGPVPEKFVAPNLSIKLVGSAVVRTTGVNPTERLCPLPTTPTQSNLGVELVLTDPPFEDEPAVLVLVPPVLVPPEALVPPVLVPLEALVPPVLVLPVFVLPEVELPTKEVKPPIACIPPTPVCPPSAVPIPLELKLTPAFLPPIAALPPILVC
jgi:hypothetical protein